MLRIFKFGGECTSLELIHHTINLIFNYDCNGLYLFSATNNYTNNLISQNYDFIDNYHKKLINILNVDIEKLRYFKKFLARDEKFLFLAVGELLTIELMSEYLKQNNKSVGFTNGIWTIGLTINEDGSLNRNCIETIRTNLLTFDKTKINIIGGFGAYFNEELLTLSRGGGDTCSVILAEALNLTTCCVVKTVHLSVSDPREFYNPKIMKAVNTNQLIDFVKCGNKIIAEEALHLANDLSITILIFNLFYPSSFQSVINPFFHNVNNVMVDKRFGKIFDDFGTFFTNDITLQCNMFCPRDFRFSEEFYNFIKCTNEKYQLSELGKSIAIIDTNEVDNLITYWNKIMNPIIPHLAVKSLPDNKIISKFEYFDCASANEIKQVLELNKNPNNIIFANTAKTTEDILFAISKDVKLFTVDGIPECLKLLELCPDCKIVLRLTASDEGAQFTKFAHKYGCINYKLACQIIDLLVINHNLKGFSFHVGCGQTNSNAWNDALIKIDELFNYIKINYPMDFNYVSIIDIGGGFSLDEKAIPLEIIKNSINPWIIKYPYKTFIAECGRYFTATAMTLLSPIISSNIRKNNLKYYVIANSIHHTFSCILFDLHKPNTLTEMDWINSQTNQNYNCVEGSIVGYTCDGIDVIYNGLVPADLQIGSLIIFPHIGAYSNASANCFNGFLPCEIIYYPSEEIL